MPDATREDSKWLISLPTDSSKIFDTTKKISLNIATEESYVDKNIELDVYKTNIDKYLAPEGYKTPDADASIISTTSVKTKMYLPVKEGYAQEGTIYFPTTTMSISNTKGIVSDCTTHQHTNFTFYSTVPATPYAKITTTSSGSKGKVLENSSATKDIYFRIYDGIYSVGVGG